MAIIKKISLLCASVALSAASLSAGNTNAEMEKKIDALLSRMTLEEKIGQLNQQTGQGYSETMVQQIKGGAIGSILNEVDPSTDCNARP